MSMLRAQSEPELAVVAGAERTAVAELISWPINGISHVHHVATSAKDNDASRPYTEQDAH